MYDAPSKLRVSDSVTHREVAEMSVSKKSARTLPWLLLPCLIVITTQSSEISATQGSIVLPTPSSFASKPCSFLDADSGSPVLFSDEFDGNELDRDKWEVFPGALVVGEGWLTLSDADIQSKSVFRGGRLQGVIWSSDWKSQQGQFTDSSFGFEHWTGSNGRCHYGILFKASGHLALLRPQPDVNGDCSGDPLYQAYPPISNWDTIRAGNTVSFALSWCSENVTLQVSGNGQEGQTSYTGQAVPNAPLKIRLSAQPTETYKIDYVRLYACYAVYLPMISQR